MFETTVIGNIGRNAVVAQHGENSVINFSLAVNESGIKKDGTKWEKTTWLDCSLWRQSTKIAEYLKTGTMIWARGAIGLRQWQSAGGEAKAGLTFIIDQLDLITVKDQVKEPE